MSKLERRNAVLTIIGESVWGLQSYMIMSATVLTILLRHFGAQERTIGLVPAIDTTAVLLPQVIGVYLFRSHRTRKRRILLWHFMPMIPLLFVLGGTILAYKWFSPGMVLAAALLCWGGYLACVGVVLAAWQDWMSHLFHERIRGTVTGMAWGMSSLLGVAGALVAAWAIGRFAMPQAVGWLYLAAGVIAVMSIVVFMFIRDPAEDLTEDHSPPLRHLLACAKMSFRDRRSRLILIGRAIAAAGFAVVPFYTVYYLSPGGGGLSESTVVSFGAAQTVGSAIFCMVFGRLGDRLGHRLGFLIGAAMQVASLACALLIPGPVGACLAYLFAGCVGGVSIVSSMNLWLECCPHDMRSAHIMVGNLMIVPICAIIPILGGQLAGHYGVRTLMGVSLAISLVAVTWIGLAVREPRKIRKVDLALAHTVA